MVVQYFRRAGEIVRGESPTEGAQRRAAMQQIRMKQRAAAFKSREAQAIKVAQQREVILAEAKLRKIKQRTERPFMSLAPSSGGMFGSPPMSKQINTRRSSRTKRRGKKRYYARPQPQPKKFDILGL